MLRLLTLPPTLIRVEFTRLEYWPSGSFGTSVLQVTAPLAVVKRAHQKAIRYSMGSLILYLRARQKRKQQKKYNVKIL